MLIVPDSFLTALRHPDKKLSLAAAAKLVLAFSHPSQLPGKNLEEIMVSTPQTPAHGALAKFRTEVTTFVSC